MATKSHKSIVICLDHQRTFDVTSGTSVVAQFYSYLLKGDIHQALLYTNFSGDTTARITLPNINFLRSSSRHGSPAQSSGSLKSRLMRSAYKDKILEVYLFIAKHYKNGDKISIFGSGQGALIACAVLGMIEQIGIFIGSARNNALYDPAYDAYIDAIFGNSGLESTGDDSPNQERSSKAAVIKNKHSASATVEFFGLWNAEEVTHCKTLFSKFPLPRFRHALSLRSSVVDMLHLKPKPTSSNPDDPSEVWFEGDGNGDSCLSNISLRWMINQCSDSKADICFVKKDQYTQRTETSKDLSKETISEGELGRILNQLLPKQVYPSKKADNKRERLEGGKNRPGGSGEERDTDNKVGRSGGEKSAEKAIEGQENRTGGPGGGRNVDTGTEGPGKGISAREVENVDSGAESSKGGKSVEGSRWLKNQDFYDVIKTRATGTPAKAFESRNRENSSVHWTVKAKMDIIGKLQELKISAWNDEEIKDFFGDKINLLLVEGEDLAV